MLTSCFPFPLVILLMFRLVALDCSKNGKAFDPPSNSKFVQFNFFNYLVIPFLLPFNFPRVNSIASTSSNLTFFIPRLACYVALVSIWLQTSIIIIFGTCIGLWGWGETFKRFYCWCHYLERGCVLGVSLLSHGILCL